MAHPPAVFPSTLRGDHVVLFGHPQRPGCELYPRGEVLGRGGFGEVYEAGPLLATKRQTSHSTLVPRDWPVALAIYARKNDPRVAQGMRHLNSALHHGVDDAGAVWVLLPRMDSDILKLGMERVTPAALHQIAMDALRGLSAFHAVGLSHRDVKLENILITSTKRILDALGRAGGLLVQISDFGLAERMDEDGNVSRPWCSYLTCPEATSAVQVDGRLLDGYALGLCIEYYFVRLVSFLAGSNFISCLQRLHAESAMMGDQFPRLLAELFRDRNEVHAPTGRHWNTADWCSEHYPPSHATSCLNASEAELRSRLAHAGLSDDDWQRLLMVQNIAQQLLVIKPEHRASPESLLARLDHHLEPEAGDQPLVALLQQERGLARQAAARITHSELIFENLATG